MKNKFFTLAAALALAAVLGGAYAAPAFAAAIKAALVKNVDEPGRAPFRMLIGCSSPTRTCAGTSSDAVPAGKRFIVQYAGLQASTKLPGVEEIFILGSADLGLHLMGQDANGYYYSGSGPVFLVFEAGDKPTLQLTANGAGATARIMLIGYLVDLSL